MIDVLMAEVEQSRPETAAEAEALLETVWSDGDRVVEWDDEDRGDES